MKKLLTIIVVVLGIGLLSCSKETTTPISSGDSDRVNNASGDSSVSSHGPRPKGNPLYGSIEGSILPYNAKTYFKIYSNKYLSHAYYTDTTGMFQVNSLTEGVYNIAIFSVENYKDTVITGIIVKGNFITRLGVIVLKE